MSSSQASSPPSSPDVGGVALPLSPPSPASSSDFEGVASPESPTQFVLPSLLIPDAPPQSIDPAPIRPGFSPLPSFADLVATIIFQRHLFPATPHPHWNGFVLPQLPLAETYPEFLVRIATAVNQALGSTGPALSFPEYQSILNGAIAESQVPEAARNRRSPVIDRLEAAALARGLPPDAALAEALRGWGEYLREQNQRTDEYFRRMRAEGRGPQPPPVVYETPRQRTVTAREAGDEECVCGICLEPLGEEGDVITVLPCVGHDLHFFHGECIERWMAATEEAKRCPFGCAQREYDELYN